MASSSSNSSSSSTRRLCKSHPVMFSEFLNGHSFVCEQKLFSVRVGYIFTSRTLLTLETELNIEIVFTPGCSTKCVDLKKANTETNKQTNKQTNSDSFKPLKMGSNLTGDDRKILERTVEPAPLSSTTTSTTAASLETLLVDFEVEKSVRIIQDRGFSKVHHHHHHHLSRTQWTRGLTPIGVRCLDCAAVSGRAAVPVSAHLACAAGPHRQDGVHPGRHHLWQHRCG